MIKCDINLSVSFLVIFLPFLYDLFVIIFDVVIFENVDANIPLIKGYGGIVRKMNEMAGERWKNNL